MYTDKVIPFQPLRVKGQEDDDTERQRYKKIREQCSSLLFVDFMTGHESE